MVNDGADRSLRYLLCAKLLADCLEAQQSPRLYPGMTPRAEAEKRCDCLTKKRCLKACPQ
jgi:hypothetical protein